MPRSRPLRQLVRSALVLACAGVFAPAACAPTPEAENGAAEGTSEIASAVTVGNWAGMTNGQCVHGVYSFYEARFGIDLPGCCLPPGDIGNCDDCGACMIWQSGQVQPPASLFSRHAWGTAMPSTYDIVVYPPRYASGGPGHVAAVDHMESSDPNAWQALWVMDTNWNGDEKKATGAHTVNRAPYGFYHLKSLGPVQPACTPTAEVCDGKDNDCNGQVDEGEICEQERVLLQTVQIAPPTTSDVDGDGRADLCARAGDGFHCRRSSASGLGPFELLQPLSDASGWADRTNYASLRMGDLDGDGRADLCARGDAGIACWTSEKTPLGTPVTGPAWSDAGGWTATAYLSTLRLADIDGDGKEDLCARAAKGMVCHRSTGTGFGPEIAGPAWSDAAGFASAKYYATLRTGDVTGDGKADLCIRDNAGMLCVPATDEGFGAPFRGPAWSDANGWGVSTYYGSIRLADVNGDGKADLCARSGASLDCHFSTGTGFGAAVQVAALSDAAGWGDPTNYESLRVGDIDGDGAADLCARGDAGLACWKLAGDAFVPVTGPAWSDANGWSAKAHNETLRLADADGDNKADLCGRAAKGWLCAKSTGEAFVDGGSSDTLADAQGWNVATYYATIFFATPLCKPRPEICNQIDDDCDGLVDEDDVCKLPPSEPGKGAGNAGTGGSGGQSGTAGSGQIGAGAGASNGLGGSPSGAGTGGTAASGGRSSGHGAPTITGSEESSAGGCSVGANRASGGYGALLGLLALRTRRRTNASSSRT